ncbi:MAG: acyltransferase family protein [Alicyclobacillus sp.]|nr:acyltransferase family protein [Alicyclobacillus sp.]
MPKPAKGNGRYMAGLDGLRAIAVLAVMAYHLNLSFAPGGLLGVGVFFVLSGYLITDLLINQWRATQRIDFKDFWLRRARRLLPALLLMLAVTVLWVAYERPSQLVSLRGDVLAAVLYVSNWWFVFHHVSYFASFGPPTPFGHLWSLAVEEQFYLLWPLLLFLGLRWTPRRGALVGCTTALAAASAVAMALIYQPGTDPSRVYYGTDTRAFSLLIGAALAMVWPSTRLSRTLPRGQRFAIDAVGTAGIATILAMVVFSNEYQNFLYRGGMVVLSLATAAAVAALAHPASRLAACFGIAPLRWLGVRSYGIYLWHYPVIVLTTPLVDTGGPQPVRMVAQVLLSIALAALSWQLVEEPIRRGYLAKAWADLRRASGRRARPWLLGAGALVAVAACYVGVSGSIPLATASSNPADNRDGAVPATAAVENSGAEHGSAGGSASGMGRIGTGGGAPAASRLAGSGNSGTQPGGESGSSEHQRTGMLTVPPASHTEPPTSSAGTAGGGQPGAGSDHGGSSTGASEGSQAVMSGKGVTAIGDSVMIDIQPYLSKLLPGSVIDGQVGRQMYQAPTVIQGLEAKGELGHIVILELGTNGPFTQSQLESLLRSLGNRQIVLVNTRVPRSWQNVVNQTDAAVAADLPNVTLVNWYAASANENGYFAPDGVHLNPAGAEVYARLVAQAVAKLSS